MGNRWRSVNYWSFVCLVIYSLLRWLWNKYDSWCRYSNYFMDWRLRNRYWYMLYLVNYFNFRMLWNYHLSIDILSNYLFMCRSGISIG